MDTRSTYSLDVQHVGDCILPVDKGCELWMRSIAACISPIEHFVQHRDMGIRSPRAGLQV